MSTQSIKKQLFDYCQNAVLNRISTAKLAMVDAQAAANNESKSTAGDKHDTSRAMMQIQVEQASAQLAEAEKMQRELARIDSTAVCSTAQLGALVKTTLGNYFMAVAAGKVTIDNEVYFIISPQSPIGTVLKGKSVNQVFTFNDQRIKINEIF